MSFFVMFFIKIFISKTNNIMFCTFSWSSSILEIGAMVSYLLPGPWKPVILDQNLNSRTSSAESGVVTVGELTFNSAEFRIVEVVSCVSGYSQSPISSFPISLSNASSKFRLHFAPFYRPWD